MAKQVKVDDLTDEIRTKIAEELEIEIAASKYANGAPPKFVHPYSMVEIEGDDHLFVPFAYGTKIGLKRPERSTFPEVEFKFNGKLRPEQKVVRKEAISHLNKYGCTLIAAFPGFGKCLREDTPVIMHDGTVKMVQNIVQGDTLMGDDSTARNVLSTCVGLEDMHNIVPIKGDTFGCNESHILSLKFSGNKSIVWDSSRQSFFVKWFDPETLKRHSKYFKEMEDAETFRDLLTCSEIIDISVKDYLSLGVSIQERLKLYRVGVDFPAKVVDIDPYLIGLWLGDGTQNRADITNVDEEIVDYMVQSSKEMGLKLRVEDVGGRAPTYCYSSGKARNNHFLNRLRDYNLLKNKHIPHVYKCNSRSNRLALLAGLLDSDGYLFKNCYEITQKREILANDIVYLARSLGFTSYVKKVRKSCMYKGEKRTGTYHLVGIYGQGLEDIPTLLHRKKAVPRKQIKDPMVSGFKVVPIEDKVYYGFCLDGNHRFLLGDFTVTHNTCTAINLSTKLKMPVLIVTHRIVLIKQWQFALAQFAPTSPVQVLTAKSKMKECDFYIMNAINVPKMSRDFFKDIGLLIVDEAHLIMAERMSQCMQMICPRYVIGLTATPNRPDGLDVLLDLYFGTKRIYRKLYRKHTVYKIETSFKPETKKNRMGLLDWGALLESQCGNQERNDMIVRLVTTFKDLVILILCKRVSQANYLVSRLEEEKVDVTSLIGKQQTFEKTARILVGTTGKAGVGFDHKRLNALILASDIEGYFIQYLGRCMRTEEVVPIIFDIVDVQYTLKKHFATRQKVYFEHGGTVKKFAKEFPDFKVI